MIAQSTSRGKPVQVAGWTRGRVVPWSRTGRLRLTWSNAWHPKTRLALLAAAKRRLAIPLLITVFAATAAPAEDARIESVGPDAADLKYYFDCSKEALTRVFGFEEALKCTRAYTRIKLSFVPGVDYGDFEGLSAQERATVNLVGYRRYLEWLSENPAAVEALSSAHSSSNTVAER